MTKTNDVANEVTQQERGNNNCYASVFRYIYIYIYIYIDQAAERERDYKLSCVIDVNGGNVRIR